MCCSFCRHLVLCPGSRSSVQQWSCEYLDPLLQLTNGLRHSSQLCPCLSRTESTFTFPNHLATITNVKSRKRLVISWRSSEYQIRSMRRWERRSPDRAIALFCSWLNPLSGSININFVPNGDGTSYRIASNLSAHYHNSTCSKGGQKTCGSYTWLIPSKVKAGEYSVEIHSLEKKSLYSECTAYRLRGRMIGS